MIEILLVLGLIGVLTGVVVINANAVFKGFGDKPLPEILKNSIREARFQAAQNKEATYLGFDPEKGDFVVLDDRMSVLETIPSGYDPEKSHLEVKFYRLLPEKGVSFSNRFNLQREETERVAFFPDRSSTPFEVTLQYEGQSSTHRYDPFSDIEIVEAN